MNTLYHHICSHALKKMFGCVKVHSRGFLQIKNALRQSSEWQGGQWVDAVHTSGPVFPPPAGFHGSQHPSALGHCECPASHSAPHLTLSPPSKTPRPRPAGATGEPNQCRAGEALEHSPSSRRRHWLLGYTGHFHQMVKGAHYSLILSSTVLVT